LRRHGGLHRLTLLTLVAAAPACALLGLVAIHLLPFPYIWVMGHGAERDVPGIAAGVMKSYGTAVSCLMPVVLWAGWRLGGRWRFVAVAYQALALALLASLESRSGLIAGAAGVGVLGGWLALRHRRGWLLLLLVPLVLAVFAGAFLDNQRHNGIAPALGLPSWLVDDHRQQIWAFSLHYLPGRPVFGYGLDVINTLPGAHDYVPGTNVEYIPSHPHDFAIEVLVETGAVGFAAMMAALVLLAVGMVRATRRCGAPGAALLGLSAAFWVPCLISYSFWSYWWQATYVMLMAIVAAPLAPGLLSGGLFDRRELR
jgi:O-antigen ligase